MKHIEMTVNEMKEISHNKPWLKMQSGFDN